jgi:hypothetical protein
MNCGLRTLVDSYGGFIAHGKNHKAAYRQSVNGVRERVGCTTFAECIKAGCYKGLPSRHGHNINAATRMDGPVTNQHYISNLNRLGIPKRLAGGMHFQPVKNIGLAGQCQRAFETGYYASWYSHMSE